ncbi:MAG: hydroxyacylglutathione hydrolase [Pseudomonadota bacterium]
MNKATVKLVPILSDNYAFILHKGEEAAVIDPGQPEPVIHALNDLGLKPSMVLNTHHHSDHIAGNAPILQKFEGKLVGPENDTHRIPHINHAVKEGSKINFADEEIQVFEAPGHTSGHVCFYLPQSQILFAGDVLFVMGCGRAFEGTAEQLYHSIQKIKAFPPETEIYCGHEYSLSNAEFCLSIEPDNEAIQKRLKTIKQYRDNSVPTVPTTLAEELETNLFLRAASVEEFTKLRSQKDNF